MNYDTPRRPSMDEYKRHLHRLAVHDDALLDGTAVEGSPFAQSVIDEKTAALMRFAATIALDAAPSSFQHAVALALAAGATNRRDRRGPRGGDAGDRRPRVVQCAPKVALALGYDVEAALERRDP